MLLIDTDIASYAIRSQHGIAQRLLDLGESNWAISVITHHELSYGISLNSVSPKTVSSCRRFLEMSKVLAFDEAASQAAALVRKSLREQGRPNGHYDTLIAGHALGIGATLVSNNTKHFENVPGLKLENWV